MNELRKHEFDLFYLPLVLQESFLPRRSGPSIFTREYGAGENKISITVSTRPFRKKVIPLPASVMGRRLLYWVIRQAKLTGSKEIVFKGAKTLFEELGLSPTSYQKRKLKTELIRLAYTLITIEEFPKFQDPKDDDPEFEARFYQIFDEVSVWNIENDAQEALFKSRLVLSDRFYDAVLSLPHQPLKGEAIKNINSALGIDIYIWASRRTQTIMRNSKTFNWSLMRQQFGLEDETSSNFKKLFKKAFSEAMEQISAYGGKAGAIFDEGVVLYSAPQQVKPKEKLKSQRW